MLVNGPTCMSSALTIIPSFGHALIIIITQLFNKLFFDNEIVGKIIDIHLISIIRYVVQVRPWSILEPLAIILRGYV